MGQTQTLKKESEHIPVIMHRLTEKGNYEEIPDDFFFQSYQKAGCRVLAIDFDGVFSSSHEHKSYFLKKAGYAVEPGDTASGRVTGLGVPKEVYERESMKAYVDMLPEAPTEPDMSEYWPKVREIPNLKIYIVTSRYDHMLEVMFGYLKKHAVGVDGVFNVNNTVKKDVLARLKPDVFVDDSPKKIYALFDDPDTCRRMDQTLSECEFVLFRNISNSYEKETQGKVVDLNGGWNKLWDYLRNKFI